jgi:Tfp pilus assembly protein PilX
MKISPGKTLRDTNGNAMIITLLLLIILTALGIYAVSISTTEMNMSFQWKAGTVGFNAAESGIYRAYDTIGPSLATTSFTVAGTLPNQAAFTGSGVLIGMSVAPTFGANMGLASYDVNSTGNAPGFVVSRRLQAVVEYGPMPIGTMY